MRIIDVLKNGAVISLAFELFEEYASTKDSLAEYELIACLDELRAQSDGASWLLNSNIRLNMNSFICGGVAG